MARGRPRKNPVQNPPAPKAPEVEKLPEQKEPEAVESEVKPEPEVNQPNRGAAKVPSRYAKFGGE